jgi:hypothetical protein
MKASGQRHASAALPLENNLCTQWTEGWMGPRPGLDVFGDKKIILYLPGFEPQISQPIA